MHTSYIVSYAHKINLLLYSPLAITRDPRPTNVVASILVEPVALHSVEAWKKLARVLPEGARRRGHRFGSREEALEHFRTLPHMKGYDERIVRMYVVRKSCFRSGGAYL